MLKSVIAAACLCATLANARSADLTGEQIKGLVAGATVEIDTPVGSKLPVRYGDDGKLVGKAGDLAWYLGVASDTGRWWVTADQLCHKWRRWLNSEPQCMRLSKQGRTIRWRNRDGHSGTARISVPPPVRVAAVVPAARSEPQTAPSEALPGPGSAAKLEGKGQERPPAVPPANASEPPRPVVAKAAVPPVAKAPAPVESQPPRKQTETARPARPMFKVANVRSDDVLNVRSGPSADFDIVGRLPPGSRGIAVTSACRSRWCPVQHRATRGWVHSAYLAAEEPLSPRPAARAPRWRSWRASRGDVSGLSSAD